MGAGIRPITTGESVAIAANQDIGAIAAEERVVSGPALDDVWAIADVQGDVDAGLVAHPRIEHHYAQG